MTLAKTIRDTKAAPKPRPKALTSPAGGKSKPAPELAMARDDAGDWQEF
jgi:hypothetical protein